MNQLTELHRALLCKARTQGGKYATTEHVEEWEKLAWLNYAKKTRRVRNWETGTLTWHYRLTDEGAKQADADMNWWRAQQERR